MPSAYDSPFLNCRQVPAADRVLRGAMAGILAESDFVLGHFCQIEVRHFLRESLCIPVEDKARVSSS